MIVQPYEFPYDMNGPMAVQLTNVSGTKLTQSTDAPSFFKITATGAEILKFYLDWDGEKHFRLTNLNIKASASVTLDVDWVWIVDGDEVTKPAYSMSLTGTQASTNCSTAYPFIEDMPPGTVSYIKITTGGAATVSVNAMGRYA